MSNNDQGGPWGNGGSKGPWGPRGGGNPYDLEGLLKKGQERMRKFAPGGRGSSSLLMLALLLFVGLWFASGFYKVNEGEQAAVLRFGKWVRTTMPGLRYHVPYPVEVVEVVKVSEVNRIDVGGDLAKTSPSAYKSIFKERLSTASLRGPTGGNASNATFMLTGDENIIDGSMTVFYYIKNIKQYLFKAAFPKDTVRIAAESAFREIIAQEPMESALTKGKDEIAKLVQDLLQKLVDEYQLGIQIQKVELQKIEPPPAVIDAFRDVQSARLDQESIINEALGYRNSIIPVARGEAQKVIQEAIGYRDSTIALAEGEAKGFDVERVAYSNARVVTKKRMYINALGEIYENTPKFVIDKNMKGIVPYLPLSELKK